MAPLAVRVDKVTKVFRLGHGAVGHRQAYRTLRDWLSSATSTGLRAIPRLFRKRRAGPRGKAAEDRVRALDGISFEVRPGEVLGLIGRNGAGKSTLLKILSRISEPTAGAVDIWGRVGSLLEVGTGFHPELSGRENIYLNGAILGIRKKDIARRFDEIVAFAEVEPFIDTPVKHYSSGMYMRLAFAVAAHMDTEILLVDEVLAVGDASFQKKCLGKMGDVARGGRTVFFVSHNMGAVRGLCRRAIWLDRGQVMADGPAFEVANRYLRQANRSSFTVKNTGGDLVIEGVCLRNPAGEQTVEFLPGQDVIVEVRYQARRPVPRPHFLIVVQSVFGPCFSANMLLDGNTPDVLEGSGCLACRFKAVPLLPQSYSVEMCIRARDGQGTLLGWQDVASFAVVGDPAAYGCRGEFMAGRVADSVPVMIPYDWLLPDGSVHAVGLGADGQLQGEEGSRP
jgi:lipopolysaccharide transport system ATP-binding protein